MEVLEGYIGSDQLMESDDQVLCNGCGDLILDVYVLRVEQAYYHETCVKCDVCLTPLLDRCYKRDARLLCKTHYFRQYSPYQCCGCGEGVAPTDMVYRLKNDRLIYHVHCHRCVQCGQTLAPGARIVVDDRAKAIACSQHFEEAPTTGAHSAFVDRKPDKHHLDSQHVQQTPIPPSFPLLAASGASVDGGGYYGGGPSQSIDGTIDYDQYCIDERGFLKRRGPRTTIKQGQLDVLNRVFDSTPKPSKHARAKLALETGLSMRVIQVWFQNRRSKERRLKHLCNWIRENEHRGLIAPLSPITMTSYSTSATTPMMSSYDVTGGGGVSLSSLLDDEEVENDDVDARRSRRRQSTTKPSFAAAAAAPSTKLPTTTTTPPLGQHEQLPFGRPPGPSSVNSAASDETSSEPTLVGEGQLRAEDVDDEDEMLLNGIVGV